MTYGPALVVYASALLLAALTTLTAGQTASPINIASQPGCSTVGGATLPKGLTECSLTGFSNGNDPVQFTFTPPADANVLFTLRTIMGVASMSIFTPSDKTTAGMNATILYRAETAMEAYLYFPAELLAGDPTGEYTLSVRPSTSGVLYSINVLTPSVNVTLDQGQADALAAIHDACCPAPGSPSNPLARFSICGLGALKAAPGSDDLCSIPPFVCNEQGQLLRFIVPGAGFTCRAGIPDAFANLTALQVLDLTGNGLEDNTEHVAAVISQLKDLRRLYLPDSGITGELDCNMVKGEKLEVLSLSANSITGSVPACYTAAPSLTQLYLSLNNITGPLPDNFDTSKLDVFFAFRQKERTLGGPFPSSIGASNIKHLALYGNTLEGSVAFPPGLTSVSLGGNQLSGALPELPANATYIDLSMNSLEGTIAPSFSELKALRFADFSSNRISGSLPALPAALRQLIVNNNSIEGPVPAFPSSLGVFSAENNRLSGDVSELELSRAAFVDISNNSLAGTLTSELLSSPELLVLNLSSNAISGSIPAKIAASKLQGLYLRNNQLTGSIPASLISAFPELTHLDLASNSLTGDLSSLAKGLDSEDVNFISFFNISNNQLTGRLLSSLVKLAMFDPSLNLLAVDPTTGVVFPLPRLFAINNNMFTGEFPSAFVTEFAKVATACSELGCGTEMDVAGPQMALTCPSASAVAAALEASPGVNISILAPSGLECIAPSGKRVDMIAFLSGKQVEVSRDYNSPSADSSGSVSTGPSMSATTGSNGSAGKGLSAGGIAGLVVGLVVGTLVLASVAYYVGYKRFYKEYRAQSFARLEADGVQSTQPAVSSTAASTEMVRPPASMV